MLPFQTEPYRAIFPHNIAQSKIELILRADDIRPYSGNRANGFLQRSYGKLFPQSDHSIKDMAMALILTV